MDNPIRKAELMLEQLSGPEVTVSLVAEGYNNQIRSPVSGREETITCGVNRPTASSPSRCWMMRGKPLAGMPLQGCRFYLWGAATDHRGHKFLKTGCPGYARYHFLTGPNRTAPWASSVSSQRRGCGLRSRLVPV